MSEHDPSALFDLDPQEGEAPARSVAFLEALKIIEDGIEKSQKGGYADIKVEYTTADDTQPGGERVVRMPLCRFIGANHLHKMVSNEEFNELVTISMEAGGSGEHTPGSKQEKIGKVAVSQSAPLYKVTGQPYRDRISAASHDDTLHDD